MPIVEFHCHTIVSKDCLTKPENLIAACIRKGIDRVVITDHNKISGARLAKEIDPNRVIIGEEIMTTHGELLAAFVKEEVPSGLSPFEAIAILREQGAFISVSHPFDKWRSGHWLTRSLLDILPLIDTIETFNARCLRPEFNHQAQEFAIQHHLHGTVGSDAHTAYEMGKATFDVPDFHDADSLKDALRQAKYKVRLSPSWVHLTSRYAVWYKRFIRR
jgi:predicted metal-dependent phosphoesterase TrpH